MTPENFAYWLQGYLELSPPGPLTKEQVEIINKHLALVFENRTKDMKPLSKDDLQRKLGEIRFDDEEILKGLKGLKKEYCSPTTTVSCSPYPGVRYC